MLKIIPNRTIYKKVFGIRTLITGIRVLFPFVKRGFVQRRLIKIRCIDKIIYLESVVRLFYLRKQKTKRL